MSKSTSDNDISPLLILVMSMAAGLCVASLYYAQPLLEAIAQAYGITRGRAGTIVTAAQLGFSVGLMFLIPLADILERKTLIVSSMLLASLGLLLAAVSRNFFMLMLGTALSGMFSVAAQMLMPFAVSLSSEARRGKVVGTILSGILLGILLVRTASGLLAEVGGWHCVYWAAFVAMLVMSAILWKSLPRYKLPVRMSYRRLITSIFELFFELRTVRSRSMIGCLNFAAFSTLWTTLAFMLSAPPYHYSEGRRARWRQGPRAV